MTTKHMHCKPVSRTPQVAQTVLQVKLDTILDMFNNALPIVDDVLGSLVSNLGTIASTITSLFSEAALAARAIPWKT
ncbi:MAG: hypothetical protein JXR94_23555 [Candidatus Hydrogenedentes bacterium]|nr:hypothetical protein [Candidatus Hydrogenedentota bacterium]